MALKEIKGSTEHKLMVASGGVSTNRDDGEPSLGVIVIVLVVTIIAALGAAMAPLWFVL